MIHASAPPAHAVAPHTLAQSARRAAKSSNALEAMVAAATIRLLSHRTDRQGLVATRPRSSRAVRGTPAPRLPLLPSVARARGQPRRFHTGGGSPPVSRSRRCRAALPGSRGELGRPHVIYSTTLQTQYTMPGTASSPALASTHERLASSPNWHRSRASGLLSGARRTGERSKQPRVAATLATRSGRRFPREAEPLMLLTWLPPTAPRAGVSERHRARARTPLALEHAARSGASRPHTWASCRRRCWGY
jgi:hypothetical protein